MRFLLVFLLSVFFFYTAGAQNSVTEYEKYPIFPVCEKVDFQNQQSCFHQTLINLINENFKIPSKVKEENYTGEVIVLFEVTSEGVFKVLYVDAFYDELKEEVNRVFADLPSVKPATYNGKPTYMQFRMPIKVPLSSEAYVSSFGENRIKDVFLPVNTAKQEYDLISKNQGKYENRQASSHINIPLSHEVYSRFDDEMNQVGTNAHTSTKPFLYSDVQPYYDFEEENNRLKFKMNSWLGRKFFNEHLVRIQGEDYWMTADIAADLQVGKDFDAEFNSTYNNTRAAVIQGGIGKGLNFYAAVYESQGRFAHYFNQYAESIKPDGGNPAIIPARGIAKEFRTDSYDYPIAEGYISYTPSKFFNFQFGHGKNFIGDGYRSLFLSDAASLYPYFKINTTFWKLKYTNTWMSLRDVRPEVTESGSFRTKYMANHYLSYNVTKRLNIGLFESVLWENDNERGFDLNYLNPVIFYRAIEFSTGSRGGNALIGLAYKYKWSDSFNSYGQLLIDEFSSGDILGGQGSYKNKIGYQLGLKYFNAFKLQNLFLQLEYYQVRPYTYSHNSVTLNYGHNNQSMAHLWGANFRELIAIARYKKNRIYGHAKLIYGERGFELTQDKNPFYGGDIYGSEYDGVNDTGNELLQGNRADFFYGELELGYILNPATNLKIYGKIIHRNLQPQLEDTELIFQKNTTWLNFGFRTDLFNWYYDF